jgi:hypothetical protein
MNPRTRLFIQIALRFGPNPAQLAKAWRAVTSQIIIRQVLLNRSIRAIDELPAWVMPVPYANQALRHLMIKRQRLGPIGGELLFLAALLVALRGPSA